MAVGVEAKKNTFHLKGDHHFLFAILNILITLFIILLNTNGILSNRSILLLTKILSLHWKLAGLSSQNLLPSTHIPGEKC